MPAYTVEMHHTAESFTALSKMQYNLFCRGNRMARALISLCLLIFSVNYLDQWWAYLVIIYAIYLTSSTKMTATRAARKLNAQMEKSKMDYPASRFCFEQDGLHIIALSEQEGEEAVLPYTKVFRLAEDADYYYIFRDRFGAYLIPKTELGERKDAFRTFVEKKTGQTCYAGTSPLLKTLSSLRHSRENGGH